MEASQPQPEAEQFQVNTSPSLKQLTLLGIQA